MINENKLIIKQLNKFGKIPQRHELLQMIERLQQENQELKEALEVKSYCKYANKCDEFDDCSREEYEDMANANMKLSVENCDLKDENQKLKEEVINLSKEVGRWNSYYDDEFNENLKLKDNWNSLKEWVNKHYDYYTNEEDYIGGRLCFIDMKNKMQEIEQGSDSNDSN